MPTVTVNIPSPHKAQASLVYSNNKRIAIRSGRRVGKTQGLAIRAARQVLKMKKVLYIAPTRKQTEQFWQYVYIILKPMVDAKILNRVSHPVRELSYNNSTSEAGITAHTAWTPDNIRGTWADEILLDEFQLMHETAYDNVVLPMLMDTGGTLITAMTPPSLNSVSLSKAKDKLHAVEKWKKWKADDLWETHSFSSIENPTLDMQTILDLKKEMTDISFRIEILAEDIEENPAALWTRELIQYDNREPDVPIEQIVNVVGVDPAVSVRGTTGIIGANKFPGTDANTNHYRATHDWSVSHGSPAKWAQTAIDLYHEIDAQVIVAEVNNGGDLVVQTIQSIDPSIPVYKVSATRGKAIRAQPIVTLYEQGYVKHSHKLKLLENEMTMWDPEDTTHSPDRLDALVWAMTYLRFHSMSLVA